MIQKVVGEKRQSGNDLIQEEMEMIQEKRKRDVVKMSR
jgi:hypothetical protein